MLVARLVETRRYAFGATIAMRRSVLDEIGGFLPLANYLADDYYLGNRVAARGYEVALSDWSSRRCLRRPWTQSHRPPAALGAHQSQLAPGRLLRRWCSPTASLWATLNLLYNHGSGLAVLLAATLCGRTDASPPAWWRSATSQAAAALAEAAARPAEGSLHLRHLGAGLSRRHGARGAAIEFRVMKNGEMCGCRHPQRPAPALASSSADQRCSHARPCPHRRPRAAPRYIADGCAAPPSRRCRGPERPNGISP